ncbi:hypothetical protein ZTR_00740 [Talaromyces verruculosus]|nr:hypothetical protein ZTR_00740 [Talaromyces verruculosus]
MTSSAAPRTIVVVGTSGNQGSGVVRALLSSKATADKLWLVRGITRDPNSAKAKKFLADHQTTGNHLTLVAGNVYDQASLQDAFADAYGVFAITSEYYPGRVLMNSYNIVLASEKCADGVVRFLTPIPGGQVMQWTDPTYDMGFFAAKDSDGNGLTIVLCRGGVFNIGPENTRGKTYLVLSPPITADEMARAFTRVRGQPAIHDLISAEEFAEFAVPVVGPAFKEDAKEMMEWVAVTPAHKICYGAFDSDQSEAVEMLGLKSTSFEDWLHRSTWKGPT